MNVNVKAIANANAPCTKTEHGVKCISSEGLGMLALIAAGAHIEPAGETHVNNKR
jgi:hypothetical protein